MVTLFSGYVECFWYIWRMSFVIYQLFFPTLSHWNSLKTKHVKNGNFSFFPVLFPFLASHFYRRHYSELLLFFVQWKLKKGKKTVLTHNKMEELFRLVLLWKHSTFIPAVKFTELFVMILGNLVFVCVFFLFLFVHICNGSSISAKQFTRFENPSNWRMNFWQEKTFNWSACFNDKIQTVYWVQHPC